MAKNSVVPMPDPHRDPMTNGAKFAFPTSGREDSGWKESNPNTPYVQPGGMPSIPGGIVTK